MIKKHNQGLTLIELLIVMAIFILSIETVSAFLIYSYRGSNYTLAKALSVENARKGTTKIVKELKEAMPSDSGGHFLEAADDFEIIFYSNIDKNDDVERIRYFLEDEKLKRGVVKPSGYPASYGGTEEIKIISSYVKNTTTPLFYYYDQCYAGKETDLPLATPITSENIDEVSLVGVKIKIETNVDPRLPVETITIESKAQFRNSNINEQ
jgi:type II secretory pathway pseudopilin PulG